MVVIPAYGREQGGDIDVCTDYRVQYPFESKIGNPFETVLKGINASNANGAVRGEAFAGEEAEKGGLTGAISFVRG